MSWTDREGWVKVHDTHPHGATVYRPAGGAPKNKKVGNYWMQVLWIEGVYYVTVDNSNSYGADLRLTGPLDTFEAAAMAYALLPGEEV